MREDEVRHHATTMLSELLQLDTLATSQQQRRAFKDARQYLKSAEATGIEAKLQLGSYWFTVVAGHIREVQNAKLKGEQRSAKKELQGGQLAQQGAPADRP